MAATSVAVRANELTDATLEGGGAGVLSLVGGGRFDLTLPVVFSGFETVQGSDQHDTIVVNQERFSGIKVFDGGALPKARWDELILVGDSFDFSTKTLIGIDRLTHPKASRASPFLDGRADFVGMGGCSCRPNLKLSGLLASCLPRLLCPA
ncbi:hypothetical protein [Microvirga terricola]|uniref:Uncharacterized protein n=1 Tax=Microvirga terricola TaxID=2719797 RepID=A0ABX0V8G9_9HYPH|nr:hypothetical protein [Microvirga terricola]NIX75276.1 hypothetical protein [Microvirga terricola]